MAHGRQQFVNMAPKPTGHMGKTPAKMITNIDSSIFDLFSGLNSTSDEKQNNTIVALVQRLSDTSVTERCDDGSLSQEVSYTLKRLIRGLGSEKPHVLKGYFTALSCLLSSLTDVNCEDVKQFIEKELSSASGTVSNEKKEFLIARTLAWGALMRSGLLKKASPDEQQTIFSDLLSCSKKKSYLPLASYAFLVDLIPTMESSAFHDVIWPLLKNELKKPWENQTLDSLLLLLVCRQHHPSVVKTKFLSKSLGTDEVMTETTMGYFAQRLIFSTYLKHSLYHTFSVYLSKPGSEHLLQKFWCGEISKLISSVKNKDLAILELFTNLVESIGTKDQISVLLTDEVVHFLNHSLSDSYKNQSPEIHAKAQKAVLLLGSVLTNSETPAGARLSVLKALLFKQGCLQFERCSQNLEKSTHIVTILIGLLESDSAKELAQLFKTALTSASQKRNTCKKDLIFAVQQFSRLVYHSTIEDVEWRVDQLKFLIHQSVFKNKQSVLIDNVCVALKQSFFRALGTKLPTLENLLHVLTALVDYVEELLAGGHSLRAHLSPDSMAAWKKMLNVVKKMKESKPGSVQQIFHLLFLYMGLYLFMDAAMAEDALKELHSCCEHSGSSGGSKRRSVKKSDEPHWVEVTVDLLLSLLSHGSSILRTVVGIVFTHLRKHVTLPALRQILEVLNPEESENALSIVDDKNGEGNDSEDEDETSENEADENGESGDGSSDDSTFEVDENSDLEDDSVDEEESIGDQLRTEIRNVLGNTASDNESVDIDEADEEELQRVDEALVKAFQAVQNKRHAQRGKKNKKQSKVDELLMHFRLRVLDLIDIFLAKPPSFSLVLPIIQPLFALLEFSSRDIHMKSLASRVRSLLTKISSCKKFTSVDGITQSEIAELLAALINKGNRTSAVFLETVDVVTDCCTMLVRCSEHLPATGEADAGEVTSICKGALQSYLKKRDCLLPFGLFRSILMLQWDGCWELADVLVESAFDNELRPIRRTHSLELLCVLIKNARLMKSESKSIENLSSSLITNAVKLLSNDSSTTHLQQKYLIGLYSALHSCLALQKASSAQVSQLCNELTRFWEKNQPHGEAKKRANELRQMLNRQNKRATSSQKRGKSETREQRKRKDSRINGGDDVRRNEDTTTEGEVATEDFTPSKKKKRRNSGGAENGNVEDNVSNKKNRRKSECQVDGESAPKFNVEYVKNVAAETSIPQKKNKIKINGGVKSIASLSDESKKKRKKRHSLAE